MLFPEAGKVPDDAAAKAGKQKNPFLTQSL
jgi:hypothetical protein